MKLVFHGGMCCGMKHIYDFKTPPDGILAPLAAARPRKLYNGNLLYARNHDRSYRYTRSDFRFFHLKAPQETAKERLKRYLDFCDEFRPFGIIEVVLSSDKYYCNNGGVSQVDTWRKTLEKEGFKEVSNCYNSNSGERIYVFHRCKDHLTK